MGAYTREGDFIIIVDIKKTLLKDLVYFRRSFFMSIKLIVIKSMNFCGNSIKRHRQPQMAKIVKLRGAIRYFTVAVGAFFSGGGQFEGGGNLRYLHLRSCKKAVACIPVIVLGMYH